MELGAAPLQRLAHQVELAHRHARRGHEDVGGREAPAKTLGDRLEVIGDDTQIDGLGARLDHLRHQRVRVRVGNLTRPRLGPEVRELVARREDRDARTPENTHLCVPERREQPYFGGADDTAGLDDDVPHVDVLTRRPDEGARGDPAGDRDALAVGGDVLLGHHGIGALGQRRAGEDPHRLPCPERAGRQGPGDDPADDGQLDRVPPRVPGADGIPIHRRVRPGGNQRPRDDGFGEHATEGRHHLDPLNRQRLYA